MRLKYTYLYQDKSNQNRSGEINARNRADAYTLLRKQGIRPYRVIGDDPFNWRPVVFWGAILLALGFMILSSVLAMREHQAAERPLITLTPEEAAVFREQAQDVVLRAPSEYRYNVWRGVNARLKERGLEPLPLPDGITEEDAFQPVFQ